MLRSAKKHDGELDTYRKRAAVIGLRCGVIFQLLENGEGKLGESSEYKESKASVDFALLMADLALESQMQLFGQMLHEVQALAQENGCRKGKNQALYDELPERFTLQVLKAAENHRAAHNGVQLEERGVGRVGGEERLEEEQGSR